MEQFIFDKNHRFGRSSVKITDVNQIRFMEVDCKTDPLTKQKSSVTLMCMNRRSLKKNLKKGVGKKQKDLSGLPTNIIEHYMTEDDLISEFGESGWKQLPDVISKRYKFVTTKVEVDGCVI